MVPAFSFEEWRLPEWDYVSRELFPKLNIPFFQFRNGTARWSEVLAGRDKYY
jgi:hypothetical protein